MDTVAPVCEVSLDEAHGEVHFAISGFWELDAMRGFLDQLDQASLPLVKARRRIRVMGDMGGFVPQTREAGEEIRSHLMKAQKFGMDRVAIVNGSSLTKMQYRRLSKGITVEYFDSKAEAFDWLRSSAAA